MADLKNVLEILLQWGVPWFAALLILVVAILAWILVQLIKNKSPHPSNKVEGSHVTINFPPPFLSPQSEKLKEPKAIEPDPPESIFSDRDRVAGVDRSASTPPISFDELKIFARPGDEVALNVVEKK